MIVGSKYAECVQLGGVCGTTTNYYTVSGNKEATLFSTTTFAFISRFYNFCAIGTGINTQQLHIIYLKAR